MLGPGDLIFHPGRGFGTSSGLIRRHPLHPLANAAIGEAVNLRH